MSRELLTHEVSELVMRGFQHGQEGYSAVAALVDLIEREKAQAAVMALTHLRDIVPWETDRLVVRDDVEKLITQYQDGEKE